MPRLQERRQVGLGSRGRRAVAAFDEAAVRKAAQARAGIEVELEVAHARAMSQIFSVLTAEQKAKLAEIHQQMEQRRQEWESQHPNGPEGHQP